MNLFQLRLLIFSAVVTICVILFFGAVHAGIRPAELSSLSWLGSNTSSLEAEKESLAYMTFLVGTESDLTDSDISHDNYFEAARLLGYQLLHNNNTKTRLDIPFVVLVTPDVSEEKRARLVKDGATVIPVEILDPGPWLHAVVHRWRDVVTKLRAWELTQYSRVLFLDGDIVINRCLDDLFLDPAAQFRPVAADGFKETAGEDTLKADYVLASLPETKKDHDNPPHEDQYRRPDYLTAGFFMFSPSIEMFNFYVSLTVEEGHFDGSYPEQNLLNYAHRLNGTVPWQRLEPLWNVNFPTMQDKANGVASMHEKWWSKELPVDLHDYLWRLRWQMEGFHEHRDLTLASS